ncbi:lysoplasmalogenase family protein [Aquidulcibacter sp.]|uniref:lysoplasmalogenase family protein n=1 Tax=Aquidulcibacter sp. TaxID=2052990 RepID=UPI0025BA17E2|nr:lysoplasmalogenase family protein [Aquidulcibacter sp.]MCA3697944.1 lysoplasmalogenase [Aquidulcibacter sp.]
MAASEGNKQADTDNQASKIVLTAAIIIGLTHTASWSADIGDPIRLTWRFASVGLLALYAMLNARNTDGWLLTAVMFISACSDILLVIVGQAVGAMTFIVADFFAIALYCRNLRPNLSWGWYAGVGAFVASISALSYLLPNNRDDAILVAAFVVPLATMAALTFLTRFQPFLVGLGAMMVLGSDMLIFGRMGPLQGMSGLSETIWLCYFVGEVLVAFGVTRGLMAAPTAKPASLRTSD